MRYGLSLKSKVALAVITAALILTSMSGNWKIGMGIVLIMMSMVLHKIHQQQKQKNR